MSDDDPKPCPFCGAVPQTYVAFGGPAVCCETCDIEMLLSEWNNRSVQPENDALRAENERLREALGKLHHAVCGETGFAECVRAHSGLSYPWPALDEADELVIAFFRESRHD